MAICYVGECQEEADGFSAYCLRDQPEPPEPITGKKMCLCAGCGERFTTVRTFDSHISLNGCKDPRRMFDRKGRRKLVLTMRGWAKNPELEGFNTWQRTTR